MSGTLTYALSGLLLGLNGGFAPGPLTALVLSEGISHGRRAGMLAGLAPLMTDGPIVVAALLLVAAIPGGGVTLGVISAAGSLVLVHIATKELRAQPVQFDGARAKPGRTVLRAIGVNFLNPNPYLFWFTICAPQMVAAYRAHGLAAPAAFLATFYAVLVGVKLGLGFLAGTLSTRLRPRMLLWINRMLAVVMLGYAAFLAYKAYLLIGG